LIVFDLKCRAGGHVFEGWFASGEDYDAQQAKGLVSCPVCGGAEVDKAPMAPAVPAKGNAAPDPRAVKKMLAEMASLQKRMLEKSEHVGDRFPDEARAIHLGEAEARAIHGRASLADARSLADEGIPVAPLPFPVPEPGEEN
jgi:hypothetical protein